MSLPSPFPPTQTSRPDAGPWPAPDVLARRVEAPTGGAGEFTYTVISQDRRLSRRQRTRLRSGKLVHRNGLFLCECLVSNRSASG